MLGGSTLDVMKMLSRDEVQRLTPDQQLALANLEAEEVRLTCVLVNRARGGLGAGLVAGLLMGTACGLAIYSNVEPRALQFAVIAAAALVGFQMASTNRRIDALMLLIDKNAGTQQTAAPNGGPATPLGGPGIAGGPPSVS